MAIYLIGRGMEYHREGIDDIGDIYEIFDGPASPSGPGYALADIVTIEILSREEVDIVLNAKRPTTDHDPATDKEYWQNPEDSNWYEIKIQPKYELNFSTLTLEDRTILANEHSTSLQQVTVLGKIRINLAQYEENTQTLRPER